MHALLSFVSGARWGVTGGARIRTLVQTLFHASARTRVHSLARRLGATRLRTAAGPLACIGLTLSACSGVETIPADTATFTARNYHSYAWRSEPLTQRAGVTDKATQADPIIRAAIAERLAELGYREVARDEAEFLVEYFAAAGFNEGLLSQSGTNIRRSSLGTINRLPDGATMDNAYALSGVVATGNLLLVFVDAEEQEPSVLWQVGISTVIEDANRVNERAVRRAIRQGLSTLPSAGAGP